MATSRESPTRALAKALASSLVLLAATPPARAGDEGVRLGNGRLQVGLETETHHVANPGYASAARAVDDACLVVRPRLRLELGADRLSVELVSDLEYRRYLGLESPSTVGLSTVEGHLSLELQGNRGRAVSWRAHQRFARQADAANDTSGYRLLHVSDDLGAGLDWRPGGGALLVTAEWALWYDRFDRDQAALVTPSALDNLTHRPVLRATWKFLPRTAVLVEALGVLTTYTGAPYRDERTGTTVETPDTAILLAYVGATGSVTARLSALAKVGYGDNFLAGDRVRTVVGQAELRYALTEKNELRVGFARVIAPASFFGYVVVDRPYVQLEQRLFGRSSVAAKVAYGHLDFGRAIAGAERERSDRTLDAELTLEHRLGGWLAVTLSERLERRGSTYRTPGGDPVGYTVNDVFVRLAFDVDGIAAVIAR